MLLPYRRPLQEEEVLQSLATAPKPLGCVARTFKQALALGMWTYGMGSVERSLHENQAAVALSSLRANYAHAATSLVEVRGLGERLLLEWGELERWIREYDLIFAGYGVGLPDEDAQAGVVAVMEFKPPSASPGIVVSGE